MVKFLKKPKLSFSLNLILDSKNRLLMLLRSKNTQLGCLQWGLPAGKIEKNETPFNAAVRERNEEIGSQHSVQLEKTWGPIRDSFYGGNYELHLFQYSWIRGTIQLNNEHIAFRWVAKQDIAKMDIMLGVEEDIEILGIWPKKYLNSERLPKKKIKSKKLN